MEIYDAWNVTDNRITLNDEKQLESLFECIRGEKEVLLRWNTEDENEGEDVQMSRILITEGLMAKVKDGRLVLESRKSNDDDD